MAGIPSWATVTGLTGAALAVVSVLAIQASGSPTASSAPAPSPKSSTTRAATPSAPPPVPPNSDTGKRIVYSLSQQRVWVIPPAGTPVATFTVTPGTVPATPGTYYVDNKQATSVGSDGAHVEHVVFFEFTAGAWAAFSARVDDQVLAPDPGLRTGAIRAHRADITKIWNNTVKGSTVVVLK
jgi:hypothetical protein